MKSKDEAKRAIEKLLERYLQIQKSGELDKRYGKGKEANTKKDFIEPLFEALNWNVRDSQEVSAEESVLRGEVDYGFFLDENPCFFVEAKSMGEPLDETQKKQALNYGINRSIPWVILTNFKQVIILNCEWKEEHIWKNQLPLPSDIFELFKDFDNTLWLLSKNSFKESALDKYAQKIGKKTPRQPIDAILLERMLEWRKHISSNLSKNIGQRYSTEQIDELVQHLLVRLLFIRNCEDRGFEENRLLNVFQAYKEHEKNIIKNLVKVFEYYNTNYDSRLFELSEIDNSQIDDSILKKVLWELYFTPDGFRYDFKTIPSDVMGRLYEQYLGHVLKKTPDRAKLKNSAAHRKEQGIYYTPTYIVDYIVRNTIGELAKNKKVDLNKIRVLDPACGSGSFLIRAFDYLSALRSKKESSEQTKLDPSDDEPTYSQKVSILKDNIFGVDLDKKAVEIAQLNLLLKAAEKRKQLPLLEKNIQCGNSLIDDKLVAGDKAFNWQERFKEIFDHGGFDVVMGNPPYVRPHHIDKRDKKFLWKNFKTFKAKSDLYSCFMEKGIKLVKETGLFSFIVPHTWTSLESFYEIRKHILETCRIIKLVQLPKKVFQEATVETCIFVLQKEDDSKKRDANKMIVEKLDENRRIIRIKEYEQSKIKENHLYNFELYTEKSSSGLLQKIKRQGTALKNLVDFAYGLKTGDDEKFIFDFAKNSDYKKIIRSKDIRRYGKMFRGKYVWYVPDKMIKNKSTARPGDKERFESEKIIVARMGKEVIATYDDEKYYVKDAMILLKRNSDTNLRYLVGILNSKLINYFYKNYFITIDVLKNALLELPIVEADKNVINKLSSYVQKREKLQVSIDNSGDKAKLEDEIRQIDSEIDEVVYRIYGLTSAEKTLIEQSLQNG